MVEEIMQRARVNAKEKVNANSKPAREILASVTERGQVTMPVEVRKALGISKRSKVIFRVQDGDVVLKKPEYTLESIFASIPPLREPKTWDEIREIVDAERVEDYLKKTREGRA
jgi:AbrB family looped-hinge helix DNA binding protein